MTNDQITVSRELLRQVLGALEELDGLDTDTECVTIYLSDEITALSTALEQPAVEPVAWFVASTGLFSLGPERPFDDDVWQPVFAAPQAQQPQLLTDEEIKDAIRHLYKDETALQMSIDITLHEFRAIEQAVRQKAGLK